MSNLSLRFSGKGLKLFSRQLWKKIVRELLTELCVPPRYFRRGALQTPQLRRRCIRLPISKLPPRKRFFASPSSIPRTQIGRKNNVPSQTAVRKSATSSWDGHRAARMVSSIKSLITSAHPFPRFRSSPTKDESIRTTVTPSSWSENLLPRPYPVGTPWRARSSPSGQRTYPHLLCRC